MRFFKNWKTGISWTIALGAGMGTGAVNSGILHSEDGREIALNAAIASGTALVVGLAMVVMSQRKSR
ncbi:MAG: hypothetical protein F4X16_03810 [Caldilineaceae bacterium SB0661_bin_34]|nr:hypothetical protein [Caldilineaceae bacterium SB0661_bin_34]